MGRDDFSSVMWTLNVEDPEGLEEDPVAEPQDKTCLRHAWNRAS